MSLEGELTKKELCMIELYIENLHNNYGLRLETLIEVKERIKKIYADAPP